MQCKEQEPLAKSSRDIVRRAVLLLGLIVLPVGFLAVVHGQTANETLEYTGGGMRLCLACHGSGSPLPGDGILSTVHGGSHPRSPLATGAQQCETCHGPSARHLQMTPDGRRLPPAVAFRREESSRVRDEACLGCHAREAGIHWAASSHAFNEVSCTDCHRVHGSDPVMSRAEQPGVCQACHTRQRAEFLRPSAHPVQAALMTCTDCHAPHGSTGPTSLRRPSLNDTCYDCHAEKRGPLLWEHAPVREDCSNCHVPHGSAHANLLTARTPWLCQQCHLAQFHPSTVASGTGIPPLGASSSMLGQNCMNCHSRVHGSNHPSGAGFTR